MSLLSQLAHFQNRRDETPNLALARKLAGKNDRKGIREIAGNLWNEDPGVQADCVKVLYEVGALKPELIAGYAADFLKLLASRNNRLVWGGMTALGAMAALRPDFIYRHRDAIVAAIETGSVITADNGIQALALAAAQGPKYRKALFPFLANHLSTCRPKDVPQHAEKTLIAVDARHKEAFVRVLQKRISDMSGSRAARLKKVIREAEKR
jgi:hypothetical protein